MDFERTPSGLLLPATTQDDPRPRRPTSGWDPHEAERRRTELNRTIYTTPCPRCGGPLEYSENTIGVLCVHDPTSLWAFCERHTHPYCTQGCGPIPYAEVVPRPSPPPPGPPKS
jgi:hypothetical protein